MSGDTPARLPQLEQEERAISRRRRQLHERIDFLRGSGAHDPETLERLARLEAEEKEVSRARRELHVRIDALRVRAGRAAGPAAPAQPSREGKRLLDRPPASYFGQLPQAPPLGSTPESNPPREAEPEP